MLLLFFDDRFDVCVCEFFVQDQYRLDRSFAFYLSQIIDDKT